MKHVSVVVSIMAGLTTAAVVFMSGFTLALWADRKWDEVFLIARETARHELAGLLTLVVILVSLASGIAVCLTLIEAWNNKYT